MSRGADEARTADGRPHVLDDVLPAGARVLFCGTAAGAVSGRLGAPYAGPGNRFWPTLHGAGLLPAPLEPLAFREAARYGIALTDLNKADSGSDAEIGTAGFDAAAVARKVAACGARVVAFTSKTAGATALGRPVDSGPQPERFGGAEAWVLPSPSGRARRFWDVAPWRALAARVDALAPVVLCAPDKLRGAVDAAEAADALARGVVRASGWPLTLPVADGGEGTLDAFLAGGRATAVTVRARDAHGAPTDARIAWLGGGDLIGGTVLVEAAEAIALAAVPEHARDVGRASSAGAGDLVRAALDGGAARILVAVGGTASVDGGAGFLRALGADAPEDGAGLLRDPRGDLTGVDPRLAAVDLELLYDVDAPLCGPDGAAHRFGPQKGATPDEVPAYDAALRAWARSLGVDPDLPGSGAAGGLGLALRAVGATARPGAEAVLDLVGFDALAAWSSLVLTAEGSVDASTLQGKTVDAVVRRSVAAGTPVAVLGGRVESAAAAQLRARGAAAVTPLGPAGRPLDAALAAAAAELEDRAAEAVAAATGA
ncbi:glycerate kinase [Patulibacter americanus]|uniref:glycerate kinase n=1 Tax=Patulibacter americanus TaxID=588672 RepID=UPI0003B7A4F5|nr:glycerate kinase [Patulibacter americanus]